MKYNPENLNKLEALIKSLPDSRIDLNKYCDFGPSIDFKDGVYNLKNSSIVRTVLENECGSTACVAG